jgi:hypothetical protein
VKNSLYNLFKIRKHGELDRIKQDSEVLGKMIVRLKNKDIYGLYYDQTDLSNNSDDINKLKAEIKELFFVYGACARIIDSVLNEQ